MDNIQSLAPLPEAARLVPGEYPSVSVVVLNYNGLKHLDACFRALSALDYPADRLELMLVDNGSSDGSLSFMRERFPGVRVVETGANLGFAGGNDFGAERASGQYVAFLNNDTRVEPDWLRQLVDALRQGDEGTVCASSLMLDWAGEKIDFQAGALNFHGFGFQPSYGLPVKSQDLRQRDLLFACGGSMLIQRDVFLATGGFDPDYFAYFEDVDLGWRLWLLGYRITLAHKAITYHRHHGTFGEIHGHRTLALYERNALYSVYKNYEDSNLEKILPASLLLLGQRAVRFLELGGVDLSDYDMANPERSEDAPEKVHRLAVASLLAADEFRANLDLFQTKREWIQANRKRADAELWELFGQPGRVHLLNHEVDAPYAAAHFAALREFGIEALYSDIPKNVLVVSPDVLPVGDIPASGSGIRAWALGKGLASKGHNVRFTMPAAALLGREESVPREYVEGAWTPENLQSIVDALHPDVLVSCGWPNLTWLPRANLPVALDLTGPHLLERAYQGYRDVEANSEEKLAALKRADFYTCIGERQRFYFDGWLAQAGVPVDQLRDVLSVIPYSLDPAQPEHHWPDDWQGEDVRFVYGGIFLPWQNPAPALLEVASTLEEQGRGTLDVIGGKHPFHAVDTGGFGPLVDRLSGMERVRMSGLLSHDKLVERYTHAHVAVDVMQPNAERELAFPSRTVHYLWCGLPVIHAAFSEVAEYIRDWEAGWVVPPGDPLALREVVISILANPDETRRRGVNAQRLARELFSWDRTVDSLDLFVRQPYIRGERTRRKADAAHKHLSKLSQPEGYLLTRANGAEIPPNIRKTAQRRRALPAQIATRSSALIKAIAPVSGSRARPKLVAGQPRYLLPELIAGHSHGQRFLSHHDDLSGLRVMVSTHGRRNTGRLALHLRASPGAGRDIHTLEIDLHQISRDGMVAFRFPPIRDSASRWFYFVADSPDGAPGDAVSLWATPHSTPSLRAQRYEDGLPASGSLVMELEFNEVTR
jgi:GT2 family glycosyltransferase